MSMESVKQALAPALEQETVPYVKYVAYSAMDMAVISQAVSSKRIADALERIASGMEGQNEKTIGYVADIVSDLTR